MSSQIIGGIQAFGAIAFCLGLVIAVASEFSHLRHSGASRRDYLRRAAAGFSATIACAILSQEISNGETWPVLVGVTLALLIVFLGGAAMRLDFLERPGLKHGAILTAVGVIAYLGSYFLVFLVAALGVGVAGAVLANCFTEYRAAKAGVLLATLGVLAWLCVTLSA